MGEKEVWIYIGNIGIRRGRLNNYQLLADKCREMGVDGSGLKPGMVPYFRIALSDELAPILAEAINKYDDFAAKIVE